MAAPQTVVDALNKLVDDQTGVVELKADAVQKQQVADDAAHQAVVAANAVSASSQQLKDDKKALHDLIDQTFPDA